MKAIIYHGFKNVRVDYVEEAGPEVSNIKKGDRVIVPFPVSCGHCWIAGSEMGVSHGRKTCDCS